MLRTLSNRLLSKHYRNAIVQRSLSHYPIDETIFGLNEDQIKVRNKFEENRWICSCKFTKFRH